jgi:hypothetical protein
VSTANECINYAIAKGAHVLSNSWGGGGYCASPTPSNSAMNWLKQNEDRK